MPRPEAGATGWRATAGRVRELAIELALATVSATLATAPVTAFYFERASVVAAVANVVAWPASVLIIPLGAVAAVALPVSAGIAGALVTIAGWCAAILTWCASAFAHWPLAAFYVPPPSAMAMLAYGLLVLSLANARRWRMPRTLTGASFALFALVLATWRPTTQPGHLEVTFLSVGQGDSAVVRFPHGQTMVVDAGGVISQRWDPGARTVAPFLRSEGVRRIDYLVASHPHPDHIGGMPALVQRFSIGEFWNNGDTHPGGPLESLIAFVHHAGAHVVSFIQPMPQRCPGLAPLRNAEPNIAALSVGDPRCSPPPPVRYIDGVKIEVLAPLNGPKRSAFPEFSTNDNSLVLRLTYGRVHILLTGDVEKDGEALLLARGYDVSADILKAPHHGSHTSSTQSFVKAVHPRYVVFCVGLHNQFGFPAPEVERRYAAIHTERYRTDLDGAITFTTDGQRIAVHAFHERIRDSNAGIVVNAKGSQVRNDRF